MVNVYAEQTSETSESTQKKKKKIRRGVEILYDDNMLEVFDDSEDEGPIEDDTTGETVEKNGLKVNKKKGTLSELILEGKIEVEVTSNGTTMIIEVTNLTDETISVNIPKFSIFQPSSTSSQNVAVYGGDINDIPAKGKKKKNFPGLCINSSAGGPGAQDFSPTSYVVDKEDITDQGEMWEYMSGNRRARAVRTLASEYNSPEDAEKVKKKFKINEDEDESE